MLSPRRQSRRTARLSVIRSSVVPNNTQRTQDEHVGTTYPVVDVITHQSSLSSDEAIHDRLERLKVFDSTEGSPYTRRRQEVQAQQDNQRIVDDDIEIVENYYSGSNESSSSISTIGDSSVEDFSVISKNEISRSRL